jgi:hypothetical protein
MNLFHSKRSKGQTNTTKKKVLKAPQSAVLRVTDCSEKDRQKTADTIS